MKPTSKEIVPQKERFTWEMGSYADETEWEESYTVELTVDPEKAKVRIKRDMHGWVDVTGRKAIRDLSAALREAVECVKDVQGE